MKKLDIAYPREAEEVVDSYLSRDKSTEEPTQEQEETKSNELKMRNTEARSKRLNCLVRPSLYGKLKAEADRRGASFNELVNKALEMYAENI